LVKGAARRARQLQNGAQPLMPTKSMKACRVAQDEINQGRVTFVVNHAPKDLTPLEEPHSNDGIDAD
jgi:DNA-directed RNA polymerase subunit omega